MPHTLAKFGRNANFRKVPDIIGDNPELKGPSKQKLDPSETDSIATTSILYDEMAGKWELLEDLWGGTQKMRDAGEKWLPKEPKERKDIYDNRLKRSILFNAFKSTIDRLVSRPFSQSVTIDEITEDSLKRLDELSEDIDGAGRNITQFSREVFESGLKYGLAHILVDFTNLPSDVETKEDENVVQPRPFFVHVKAPSLIFWEVGAHPVTRLPILTEIRIKEVTVERVGENSNVEVIRIRIFTPDVWELWKFDPESKTFDLDDSGVNTLGVVPLITYYVKRTGQLTAEPPFEDLAWLNLQHWQSDSDQRNILRFARTGVLFGAGFNAKEAIDIFWGPNAFIKVTNENAKLNTVEYKGTAIKAGEDDLLRLEERMQLLGLQPLVERTSKSTATGMILDESKTVNDIQAWIRSLENALINAYNLAAQWLEHEDPIDLKLNIFSDFSVSMHGTKDLEALIKIRNGNHITPETFLTELKRRGILSETVDIEEELVQLQRSSDDTNIDIKDVTLDKRDA